MENISLQFVNGLTLRGVAGTRQLVLGDRTSGSITLGFDNKDVANVVDTAFPGIRWSGTTLQYSNDGITWKSFGDTSILDGVTGNIAVLQSAIDDLEITKTRLDALIGW